MLANKHTISAELAEIKSPDWVWVPTFRYTVEQLVNAAYSLTAGDPIEGGLGHHRGSPDRPDRVGTTKQMVHAAASMGDETFFEVRTKQVVRRGQRSTLSSRVFITNNRTGKRRPIDVPPEALRMLLALANADLLRLARFQEAIPPEIISYRSRGELPPFVQGEGVTIQDQFAGLVVRQLRRHGPWAVIVDLEDHFGRLPRKAIQAALRRLGLPSAVRRRLINMALLHTKERGQEPVKAERHGVEQGNTLSATLSNLVMGMVVKLLRASKVASAMYGDDIVLFAKSKAEAEAAFERFRLICRRLDFDNIRPLGTGSKDSQIIDARHQPIPLIKTFFVGLEAGVPWVGLTDMPVVNADGRVFASKLSDLKLKLAARSSNNPSPNQIRRLAGARVLSARWMIREGLINPSPQPSPVVAATEEGTDLTLPSRAPGGAPDRRSSSADAVDVDEGGHPSAPMMPPTGGGGDELLVGRPTCSWAYPDQACVEPTMWENVYASDGEPSAGADDDSILAVRVATPVGSTQSRVATEVSLLEREGDRPTSGRLCLQGVTPRSASAVGHEPTADAPVLPSSTDMTTRVNKGAVVDLTRVNALGLDADDLAAHVEGLLRAARWKRKVRALIHPGDAWVHRPGLLGGPNDPQWVRRQEEPAQGGVVVTLRMREVRSSSEAQAAPPWAETHTLVEARHRSSHGSRWTVTIRTPANGIVRQRVRVVSCVEAYARWEAIAMAVDGVEGPIAVPDYPLAEVVLTSARRRQTGLDIAAKTLQARDWRRQGRHWLGNRKG